MNIGKSLVYKEFLALKEEVNKHKWYESERAGYDIGWPRAWMSWTFRYRNQWIKERPNRLEKHSKTEAN